jgi:hypothetical protein
MKGFLFEDEEAVLPQAIRHEPGGLPQAAAMAAPPFFCTVRPLFQPGRII